MSPTALVFIGGFIALCVLAFRRHPIYGLMAYLAAFYVEPGAQWWGQGFIHGIRWVFIAAGVTMISMFMHRGKTTPASPMKSGVFCGFLVYVAWIYLQSLWAIDGEAHAALIGIWTKFLIISVMICRCVDSEQNLKLFLWSHVAGCAYLGFTALFNYQGGRFEGFGDSGLAEANAGALQLVTGIVIGGGLFLASKKLGKGVLLVFIPVIANAVVTTVSRSGFLSMTAAALVFNVFAPRMHRKQIRVLTVLAIVLAVMVTTPAYWARIASIKYAGADVEGVDTGGGRLEIIQGQMQMFKSHPLGCGHMCTSALSAQYIDARFLSGDGHRASHNTIMTMLVDHGVLGLLLYVAMLLWMARTVLSLRRRLQGHEGFLVSIFPAVAAVLAAITVADLFVQYPKLEVRVWFLSLLIVMLHLTAKPRIHPAAVKSGGAVRHVPPAAATERALPRPGVRP